MNNRYETYNYVIWYTEVFSKLWYILLTLSQLSSFVPQNSHDKWRSVSYIVTARYFYNVSFTNTVFVKCSCIFQQWKLEYCRNTGDKREEEREDDSTARTRSILRKKIWNVTYVIKISVGVTTRGYETWLSFCRVTWCTSCEISRRRVASSVGKYPIYCRAFSHTGNECKYFCALPKPRLSKRPATKLKFMISIDKIRWRLCNFSLGSKRLVFITESLCGPHEKRLLNELLSSYNTLERPVANESEPLQVRFGITLQQIIDVVSSFSHIYNVLCHSLLYFNHLRCVKQMCSKINAL